MLRLSEGLGSRPSDFSGPHPLSSQPSGPRTFPTASAFPAFFLCLQSLDSDGGPIIYSNFFLCFIVSSLCCSVPLVTFSHLFPVLLLSLSPLPPLHSAPFCLYVCLSVSRLCPPPVTSLTHTPCAPYSIPLSFRVSLHLCPSLYLLPIPIHSFYSASPRKVPRAYATQRQSGLRREPQGP